MCVRAREEREKGRERKLLKFMSEIPLKLQVRVHFQKYEKTENPFETTHLDTKKDIPFSNKKIILGNYLFTGCRVSGIVAHPVRLNFYN